jgi:hypothetical protein
MKHRIAWAAAALCALFQLAWGRPLAWDEIEFFRATRWVSLGRVPYRDFWELHTPLQWYLFAPVARFLGTAGTMPVLVLRYAQIPLWLLASWCLWRLARRSGLSAQTTGAALALLWLSRLFVDQAIEYRVDAVAVTAVIVALDAMAVKHDVLAGVLFAAAVIANIRCVPVVAVALLAVLVMRRRATLAGAAAAFALWIGALWATGSWAAFRQHVIVDNVMSDRYSLASPYTAVTTLLSIGGVVPNGFNPMLIDPAGILILMAAAVGAVMTLIDIRRPTLLTLLTILQVVNLLAVDRMKVAYSYHFLLTLALAVPLAALALERVNARVSSSVLAAAVVVRLFVTLFGANHDVLARQDFIMKEADRRTLPGEPILDGVGWVQTRPPAYDYWFLPLLARILAGEGYAKPYTVADAIARPPGAVIADQRLLTWFHDYPALDAYFRSHYVPVYDVLWLPGLSGRFDATHRLARWTVPRSGMYRVIAGDPHRLTLRRNGIEMNVSPVTLARGDRIEAVANGDAQLFIIPANVTTLFQRGPALDAPLPAPPHLPWR